MTDSEPSFIPRVQFTRRYIAPSSIVSNETRCRTIHIPIDDTGQIEAAIGEVLGFLADPLAWQEVAGSVSSFEVSSALAAMIVDLFSATCGESGEEVAIPVGMVALFAGAVIPDGWLSCDGSEIDRATYADLFAAISTTFGVGNGTSTFNLPDFRSRSPVGAGQGSGLTNRATGSSGGEETHILSESEMPAHNHSVTPLIGTSGSGTTTALLNSSTTPTPLTTTTKGSGAAHNNMHPFLTISFMIYTGVITP